MRFLATKVLVIGIGILGCVLAQNDGRYRPINDGKYRPSNDEKNSGNDGRFIYQDVKYVPMADRFGPSGSSNFDSNVVSIGSKKRPVQPAVLPTFSTTTTRTPTVIIPSPQAPLPAAFAPKASPSASPSQANDLNGAIILRQEQEETVDGYRYLYETDNGILAEESGRIEKLESGDDVIRSTGYFQYIGDDGVSYRVDYVADENGFQPTGDHLPTPPPIPPEIQEVLNILATKPPDNERTRRSQN